jgi:hypothetical protein
VQAASPSAASAVVAKSKRMNVSSFGFLVAA